jgi:uncharacterized protein (TIGR03435 family)
MKSTGKVVWLTAAMMFLGIPLLSQSGQTPKLAFDVISIKPSAPPPPGVRGPGVAGGGTTRGNRYATSNATLRTLLQQGYQQISTAPAGQLQIIGAPDWIDNDRYDIQATVDCGGGILSRAQVQLMVQSMLENRFQLKAHMEIREFPVYNLVVGKDGPKLTASADQTPTTPAGGPPQPCGPAPPAPTGPPPLPSTPGSLMDSNFVMPRGSLMMGMSPAGIVLRATGVPLANILNLLQQQVGRPVIDKTDLKGLFDIKLQFNPEGLTPAPGAPAPPSNPTGGGGTTTTATDPNPSLFTALQDLGLKLESAKGPLKVLVIDSVQKPTLN